MKVIKDRSNNALAKFPDEEAKKIIAAKEMLRVTDKAGNPMERYCYVSKSALKMRFNDLKKEYKRKVRIGLYQRRLAK